MAAAKAMDVIRPNGVSQATELDPTPGPVVSTRSRHPRDWVGPTDLPALMRLGQRTWTPDMRWHIGDFAREFGREPGGRPTWHMSVWERDGDVSEWAGSRGPIGCRWPSTRCTFDLLDAVVAWASAVARVRVSVTVPSTERYLTEALVRLGYAPDEGGHFFVAHHHSLDDIPPPSMLPDGLRVRPVCGDDEVAARAALHREVGSRPA